MHKNILTVVGITILFLGISIQPAIAVNPISTDSEEDCSICPKVSNLQVVRLKSLINRVETLNNKLSVISKYHPEVAEKYQELSDRIITLTEMSKELNPDRDYPIICNILLKLSRPFFIIDDILFQIWDRVEHGSLLWLLMAPIVVIFGNAVLIWTVIFLVLNCIEFPTH